MKERLTGPQDPRLELSESQVDIIIRLGAITLAERILPEIFEGAYEETLDNLRAVTEERTK